MLALWTNGFKPGPVASASHTSGPIQGYQYSSCAWESRWWLESLVPFHLCDFDGVPGCCDHLRSKSGDGRSLFLSLTHSHIQTSKQIKLLRVYMRFSETDRLPKFHITSSFMSIQYTKIVNSQGSVVYQMQSRLMSIFILHIALTFILHIYLAFKDILIPWKFNAYQHFKSHLWV